MSYANATVSPAERARAAASVIGIHALVGFGVVAGLAVTTTIVPTLNDDLEGRNVEVELPPPPPPEPTEVTSEVPPVYVPPAAPRPPIELTNDSPITVVEPSDVPAPVIRNIPIAPIGDPVIAQPPAPPAPAFIPADPTPANAISSWITTNDYPRRDLTRGHEGTARYRLVVGSNGRVDACEITRSTGHATLDRTTCRMIEQRARFDPATNNRGEEVVGTYTGTVSWQIPE